ncbi:Hypothetical protein POVR2_LOCUS332 [uncultured virus]|nr:Hypothetical protein POVR2_LOCUS332 [uncultured virus]
MISVLTYNILEESLAIPQLIVTSDPVHLSTEVRMVKILSVLQQAMDSRSMIALQEVGVGMASVLHQHFISNGYYSFTAHSSTIEGRNCEGVLLAYPLEQYKYISCSQVRSASLISQPDEMSDVSMNPSPKSGVAQNVFEFAKNVDRRILHLTLEDKKSKKVFSVVNYHMPCIFWWREIMTLHLEAVSKKVDELKRLGPCILVGDYNFTPEYSQYKQALGIATGLDLPCHNYNLHLTKLEDCCTDNRPTTRAINPQGKDFCERIDYILYSDGLTCLEYSCPEITTPMPNEVHGSDHAPVSAVFRLN